MDLSLGSLGRRALRFGRCLNGRLLCSRLACREFWFVHGASCALYFGAAVATAQPMENPAPFAAHATLPSSFLDDLKSTDVASQAAWGVIRHLHDRVIPALPEVRAAIDAAMFDSTALIGEALSAVAGFRANEPTLWSQRGRVSWPIPGGTLSAAFGDRRRESSTTLERHTGWSLVATASTEIQSVSQGVVVFAEPVDGLGFTVVVAHAVDLHTVYAGLLSLSVHAWQPVAAGETLGLGAAESVSGRRELYFEVRESGVPVDPALWLR